MSKKEPVVFDTNVLISALLRFNSTPGIAYQKASLNCRLVYSDETLVEIIDVFSRKKFDKYFSSHQRETFIDLFLKIALRINTPQLNKPICRDPRDDKYLALGVAAQSRFIITGDADLLVLNPYENISIINPSEFLQIDFDESNVVLH